MTQEDKAAEIGQLMLDIQHHEAEIKFPLQKLQSIAARIQACAEALQLVYGSPGENVPRERFNVSGSTTLTNMPRMDEIIALENEVRVHGRALAQLYARRSQYGV